MGKKDKVKEIEAGQIPAMVPIEEGKAGR